jgi:hypothetical protein
MLVACFMVAAACYYSQTTMLVTAIHTHKENIYTELLLTHYRMNFSIQFVQFMYSQSLHLVKLVLCEHSSNWCILSLHYIQVDLRKHMRVTAYECLKY